MDLCTAYTTSADCILEYSNIYNIKLLTLLVIGIIFTYIYIKREEMPDKTYFQFWLKLLAKVVPLTYIMFSPAFVMLLLRNTISYEVFILIIVGFYFVFLALFIGLAIYYGQAGIWRIFGFKDFKEFKYKNQELRSEGRYG